MRKKVFGRKLSRNTNTRKALFRSLGREMIIHGGIVTTFPKAKALRPELEKLANLVRKGSIDARRNALTMLGNDRNTTDLLFEKLSAIKTGRSSGFTRIIKLVPRKGDNADMARIEWTDQPVESKKK